MRFEKDKRRQAHPSRGSADTEPRGGERDGADESLIEGRNAVIEACRAGMTIEKLFVAPGKTDKTLSRVVSMAKERGAVVVECDRRKLDRMSATGAHQGVIAQAAGIEYAEVADMLTRAKVSGVPPLIVICDSIYDPGNLGAIVRSAEAAGAHGVIVPKRRSAAMTAVAIKASAGAAMHLPVARVPNIAQAIDGLKKEGLWIIGSSPDAGKVLYDVDFSGPTAIIIGSESEGMSRIVAEACDFKVSIPMKGKIGSLNASAAAAVMLYEAVRQRQSTVDS